MAPERPARHQHHGGPVLTGPRLVLAGDLAVTGPGVSIRLTGDGDAPATVVVTGTLPGGARRGRRMAVALARTGARVHVRDGRGRVLATAGPGLRSPLGWALLGTGRVRPSPRGLLAIARGTAARPTDPTGGVRA